MTYLGSSFSADSDAVEGRALSDSSLLGMDTLGLDTWEALAVLVN